MAKMTPILIRVDSDDLARVDQVAANLDLSRAAVFRHLARCVDQLKIRVESSLIDDRHPAQGGEAMRGER